jgi:hypothetical protein
VLSGRALDYLSFYRSVRRSLREIAQAGDIVVAKTDPPLLSVALASVVRQRRAHLVNWLQDIYPETASILGVPLLRGPVASALATLRNRSLREADATVVVGELMARHIKELGAVPARVHSSPIGAMTRRSDRLRGPTIRSARRGICPANLSSAILAI